MKNATSLYASYVKALLTCILLFILLAANAQVNRRNTKSSVAYRGNYQRISAGVGHTLEIKDGTLWAWGRNDFGQLGDGTVISKNSAVQIGLESNWVAVFAGYNHSFAIKSNGTLWSWGFNGNGILGDGTATNRLVPTQIGTENNWISISASDHHSLGLKSDGTMWAWGFNVYGELGDSTTFTSSFLPKQIGIGSNWKKIATGQNFSIAIQSNGTLWGWGQNQVLQNGDTTQIDCNFPVKIDSDSNWVSVNSGYGHWLGLKSDGTLWGWGNNVFGGLGIGSTVSIKKPSKIGLENNWIDISTGNNYSFAIKSDGTLWAAGANSDSQLGDSSLTYCWSFTQIGNEKWLEVVGGDNSSLGIKSNGSIWSWGNNYYGQLGNGTNTDTKIPNKIGVINNWLNDEAGAKHNLLLKSNGTIWATGDNQYGQLGNGTSLTQNQPVKINNDADWMQISAGGNHSLAIKSNGTLWGWGSNGLGQIGAGTLGISNIPIQVGTDSNWTKIEAGYQFSLGLKSDGSLWSFGENGYAQLGNGSFLASNIPVKIGLSNDWVCFSAGQIHALAIKSNGTLWTWGYSQYGLLGDSTINTIRNTPIQIGNNSKWIVVSAGSGHSLAIKSDGTLWAWGGNFSGELGDGTSINKNCPTQIGTSKNWVSVSAGNRYSIGIKADGSLWGWGINDVGQLASNNPPNLWIPTQIGNADDWTSISAASPDAFSSSGFTIGLKADKTHYCSTGYNQTGQLGICNYQNQSNFVCSSLPLEIASQPQNLTVCAGNFAAFSFVGIANSSFQWQENFSGTWNNLSDAGVYSGTSTDSLIISAASLSFNNRYYRCILSSGSSCPGSIITDSVKLSVISPQANISTVNGSTSFCAGDNFVLSANSGIGNTYKWFMNGTVLPNRNNDTLIISSGGSYSVEITFAANCISSSSVINISSITKPSSQITAISSTNICEGSFVTLKGNSGTGLSRQWQRNGVDIPNAIFVNYAADSSGVYTLIVTNSLGCDSTSNSISVTTFPYPTASISYSGVPYTCAGGTVVLHANQGSGFTYQWNVNGAAIMGANDSVYTVSQTGTNLSFTVTVTNAGICSTTSAPVIINPIPVASEICLVTVDSLSQHNVIVWEKQPPVTFIDSFRIYREDATNIYNYVSSLGYNQFSELTDTNSNASPQIKSARYKMKVVDICGSVSPLSIWHNTVKLNDQLNGNFDWNEYKVENQTNTLVASYLLQRYDSITSSWLTINTTAGTQTTMTAPNYSTHQNSLYRVLADLGVYSCVPTARMQTGINVTRSNIKNRTVGVGILENKNLSNKISLHPNPAKDEVTINGFVQLENISVYDNLGSLVLQQKTEQSKEGSTTLNISKLAAGIYTVSCKGKDFEVRKKLVVE